MRAVIIADCHGKPELIANTIEHSDYDKNADRLIFAGDTVDIGFKPMECLDLLEDNKAELLWGNHEAAIVLDELIWPHTRYNEDVYERIRRIKFKVAAEHDDVLITHAGVSKEFYLQDLPEPKVWFTKNVANHLNEMSLYEVSRGCGPLWYRPNNKLYPPIDIKQVVGHTPYEWLDLMSFKSDKFFTVDPYKKNCRDEDRFRYALIEEGNIKIVDSED